MGGDTIHPSQIFLDEASYGNYIVQAQEFVSEGVVDIPKLDGFLAETMDARRRVEVPASREAISLRISEVYGTVANEVLFGQDTKEYKKLKDHIQGYSDEQKAFLRMCITSSQLSPARKEFGEKANDTTAVSMADVWLMVNLA